MHVDQTLFNNLSVEGYLNHLQVIVVITNKDPINIHVEVFAWIKVLISLG